MKQFDYSTFLSPFTWRYGSNEMRSIWSEINKRKIWRKIWVALAKSQYKKGLVSKKELDDLIAHQNDIDIEKAHEFEKELRHDLMAEIKTYASQAQIGGGKIHLGATSMDIEDNTDTLRTKQSLLLIQKKAHILLQTLAKKISEHKNTPCMAYTHLQPAEPTTLGYRFASYAQDLVYDLHYLTFVLSNLHAKGLKGAVGTSASYVSLLSKKDAADIEKEVMNEINLSPVLISGQTGPRKVDILVANSIALFSQTIYKFAFDLRIMQSPGFSEWQEPFASKQVGSSAMPFKRNPWKSEQLCSLGRLIKNLSNNASDNASHMLLERTLDDSANRRVYIPEMFLALDEMITSATTIIEGMILNHSQIEKNLSLYGPFATTEAILMQLVKKGADRQEMHELLRSISLTCWKHLQETGENPMTKLLLTHKTILSFLSKKEIKMHMDSKTHIGLAEKKCVQFLSTLSHEYS